MSIIIYSPKYLHGTQCKMSNSFSQLWWSVYAISCDKSLRILHSGHQYIIATEDKELLLLWMENMGVLNKVMMDLQRVIKNETNNIMVHHESLDIFPELYNVIIQGIKSDTAQNDPVVIEVINNEMIQRQEFWDAESRKGYTLYVD
ncbi:hypothetical protein [Yersinia pseudotuberculosis]|uniref:hypothetical protein n=1 Tax=Yersinia pseudotuberculosis TaxID=633 RepID=UPI0005DF2B9B|nr:hypothetical protein [Yersinia pseudotuberculosis]MBO1591273.1 hypothetical protein [Yersinia pseudotuberculosis]CNE29793.1 Uncharacterised protein [Yersinia pseudotuberculosis]